jgi:hypothetical protein
MSIHLHIQADSPEQFLAYVGVLARTGALAAQMPEPQPVRVEPETTAEPETSATEDVTEAAAALPEASPAPAKRGRGRPRKAEQAAPEPETAAPEPVQAAAGLGQADEDPFGADEAETTRDPAVDHGLALELLRTIYDRPGAAAAANALLTEFGVAKFTAIPKARGTELLARARELDLETNAGAALP